VYGPDFPGETFRVLKEREIKQYGEYRTRRLVLEAWDWLGLQPRNRDGRYSTSSTESNGTVAAPPVAVRQPNAVAPSASPPDRDTRTAEPARAVSMWGRPTVAAPNDVPVAPAEHTTGTVAPPARERKQAVARPASPAAASPVQAPPTDPSAAVRARVTTEVLSLLKAGPLTVVEVVQRLASRGVRVDSAMVKAVLTASASLVQHDAGTGKYRRRRPR